MKNDIPILMTRHSLKNKDADVYHDAHLEPFGTIWEHLGTFGNIWAHFGKYGIIWDYLGPFGIIWEPLGTIWDHWGQNNPI